MSGGRWQSPQRRTLAADYAGQPTTLSTSNTRQPQLQQSKNGAERHLMVHDGDNHRRDGTNQHIQVISNRNRRWWCRRATTLAWMTILGMTIVPSTPMMSGVTTAQAAESFSPPKPPIAVTQIQQAANTLQSLLDNWERAVVDCNYADVPRELLETKNKQLLLERASTFALFDKSDAVVSCKTTNRVVRDYLGRTGKGPLANLNKWLRQALDDIVLQDSNAEDIDPDLYVQSMERVQQLLTKADSSSYAAGVADVSAYNSFDPSQQDQVLALTSQNSNLVQTREAIVEAVIELNRLLDLLYMGTGTTMSSGS